MKKTGQKSPYTLVPRAMSVDTIECLEQLLEQARSGHVIGLGFVAMLSTRGYVVDTAGEAHRNPTWTRGMLAGLDDKLSARIACGNQ